MDETIFSAFQEYPSLPLKKMDESAFAAFQEYMGRPLNKFPLTYSYTIQFPHMKYSPLLLWFTNKEECLGTIIAIRTIISKLPADTPFIPTWQKVVEICEQQYEHIQAMANAPRLTTSNLPPLSEDAASATSSPARGREMRQNLLGKLRPPPLVHSWQFYHDRQDRKKSSSQEDAPSNDNQQSYEDRLVKLTDITDVREFWETFNNFDITRLPLRDSIHLFHKGVKPVWEDQRNLKGGSWTFRVPKAQAPEFWKEICLMAIGEKLQAAVESDRKIFRDDICGVSLSIRFTSTLIQIWNRDGKHEAAIEKILATVLETLPEELKPKDGSYYYKRHDEHAGYKKPEETS